MCILQSGEIDNVQEIGCKIIRFFFCVWFLCFSFFFSSAKSLNLAGPGWARLFFFAINNQYICWILAGLSSNSFPIFSIANREKKGKENWQTNIVSHQIMSKNDGVCAYVNNDLSEAFCFANWLNFGFFSLCCRLKLTSHNHNYKTNNNNQTMDLKNNNEFIIMY